LVPHTADVMLLAWAPTVEGCLVEAVRALVACFADVRTVRPARLVAFQCDPGSNDELLVELLEEVIYLVDARDLVPVQVAVARAGDGGLVGEFGVVDGPQVALVGPVPKAVTRHGLRFARRASTWHCQVVIDV